jgi:hypothetical protein
MVDVPSLENAQPHYLAAVGKFLLGGIEHVPNRVHS